VLENKRGGRGMIIIMMEIKDKIVSFPTTIEELNANWNALQKLFINFNVTLLGPCTQSKSCTPWKSWKRNSYH